MSNLWASIVKLMSKFRIDSCCNDSLGLVLIYEWLVSIRYRDKF